MSKQQSVDLHSIQFKLCLNQQAVRCADRLESNSTYLYQTWLFCSI